MICEHSNSICNAFHHKEINLSILFFFFLRPVHITKFTPGNTQILSCSDDKTVRIWDIPGQEAISIFKEHQVSII